MANREPWTCEVSSRASNVARLVARSGGRADVPAIVRLRRVRVIAVSARTTVGQFKARFVDVVLQRLWDLTQAGLFDYVIFDEASQVDLPAAAPALYRARPTRTAKPQAQRYRYSLVAPLADGNCMDGSGSDVLERIVTFNGPRVRRSGRNHLRSNWFSYGANGLELGPLDVASCARIVIPGGIEE